ncbi:YigZ family protein [Anaerolineae bacterium CFX9]|nr:YigZ family protein [Anaerolineae bacterium CFX9]
MPLKGLSYDGQRILTIISRRMDGLSSMEFLVPRGSSEAELVVAKSRFIAAASHADSVDAAKAFIATRRSLMPDAPHHVYAFRIGHGNTTIDGMSDDGEPSGTAGPPVLSILRGTPLGDIVVVVTRYFGGTLLGTGGLVHAYSDAARLALESLSTGAKQVTTRLGIDLPYPDFSVVEREIQSYGGTIVHSDFMESVSLIVEISQPRVEQLIRAVSDATAGRVIPFLL